VVGSNDRDKELSAWTWTRGDAALTPLTRYLMHAAKLRYHLRVWAGGEALRDLRERTDRAAHPLTELIGKLRVADGGDIPEKSPLVVGQLGVETYHLAAAMTRVRELRHSVEIAAHNLAQDVPPAAARTDGSTDGNRSLFADDRGLVTWFVQQLDDDLRYADEAAHRGRLALDGAAAMIVPQHLDGSRRRERVGPQIVSELPATRARPSPRRRAARRPPMRPVHGGCSS
jgi:hypothetical protein